MALIQLIYCSTYVGSHFVNDLQTILHTAEVNNAKEAITGLLTFGHQRFLQVLEGDATRIDALYQRLKADRRHEQVVLLDYSPIAMRHFETWAMAYCHLRERNASGELVLKYSGSYVFEPYEMPPGNARHFLYELRDVMGCLSQRAASYEAYPSYSRRFPATHQQRSHSHAP